MSMDENEKISEFTQIYDKMMEKKKSEINTKVESRQEEQFQEFATVP